MQAKLTDTRTLADLAREAIAVQDACNLSGVAHGFSRSVSRLWALLSAQGTVSTEAVNNHPITRAWVDKLASLAAVQGSSGFNRAAQAHAQCDEMANL